MAVHKKKHTHSKLIRDLLLIALSVFATMVLIKVGAIQHIVSGSQEIRFIGSFISGLFFTSLFTIAPASIALAKISQTTSPFVVAFWGALGAMFGDLILFLFIRDSLVEDIYEMIKGPRYRRIISVFKFRIFRWFTPLLGAMLIVSPLPDELGLALMGFSKVKTRYMLPITFVLNYLGVLLIALIAGTL